MSSEMLRDLAQAYRDLGINMQADRVPAPERHRPTLETHVSNGYHGIVVKEPMTGAFIHCEDPVEVRQ